MGSKAMNNQIREVTFPRLYTIHSQKGGVGKTSIALAIAGFAAVFHKKKTLIIDADLTGSSLADMWAWSNGRKLKYLNELILAKPSEFAKYTDFSLRKPIQKDNSSISAFYQKIPLHENISYFPSSPCFEDILKIIPLISQEDHLHFFRHRLEDIIGRVLADSYEMIIIDHPPGLYGVSKASLALVFDQAFKTDKSEKTGLDRIIKLALKKSAEINIATQAILITTPDPVDYKALLPSLSWLIDRSENYNEWFGELQNRSENQLNIPIELILNKGRMLSSKGVFDPPIAFATILKNIENNIFPDKRSVTKELVTHFKNRAKNLGALSGRYVADFQMETILDAILRIKNNRKIEIDGMEAWCRDIGKSVGLYSINPYIALENTDE